MLKHDVDTMGPGKQAGFTLIELLIVIAIIAILAAIAIPMFMKYKQGAYLASVRSDVKNSVTALESYDATNGGYPTLPIGPMGPGPVTWGCTSVSGGGGTCTALAAGASGGDFNISTGNTITISSDTSCANGYLVSGYNANITAGSVGSSSSPVSYDSCTGQYSGF